MSTIGERITNLREYRFLTKRELAKHLKISESQLSRIENGKTETVNSDILIALSKFFHVSADYILGLSPLKENNHILSELHLTEAACEKLVRREINGETLSRLMEHDDFGLLIRNARAYFDETYAVGVSHRNEILNTAASFLHTHADESQNPTDVKKCANDILQARTGAHEIEMTEIRNLTMRILKETKNQIDEEKSGDTPASKRRMAGKQFASRLSMIAEQVHEKPDLSDDEKLNYITDQLMDEIGKETKVSNSVLKFLKPIYKVIIRSTGKPNDKEIKTNDSMVTSNSLSEIGQQE